MKTILKKVDLIDGVARILAIPVKKVLAINGPEIELSDELENIAYDLESAIDSVSINIQSVESDAGTHYACSARGFVAGVLHENEAILKELSSQRSILIYMTYDRSTWRLGSKDIGMGLTYQKTTSGRIGYNFLFSGDLTEGAQEANIEL
jgi:hypothetical protein